MWKGPTWMLTPRDLELLAWIARFGYVTQDQVQRWIADINGGARSHSVSYTRLKVLADHGLVETRAVLAGLGRAVWATRDGGLTVGAVGRARPPRVSSFEHDALVVDLALHVQVTRPHHRIVTEREMRAEDTANQLTAEAEQPRWALGVGRQRRFPDLVSIAPSGVRVIHEVERTAKDHRRLVRLMLQRLDRAEVGAVRYYVANGAGAAVERAAAEARRVAQSNGTQTPLSVHPIGVWT